ncbi:hypothetical protein [Actinomadura viridis]|uniref:DUF4351 domain-containing protein n=1 Tax=Actinomadura viridis TaxID=58110 RepID=A0A931DIE4_9ACTN|nr:hypothetical protein [Actinomadura viridis]MBG6088126.1 hypothetical protein [Actinomadura viridis]
MPSIEHEMPLEMVRNRPALAPELLRTLFDLKIPEADVSLGSETYNDCDPTEFRCDATIMMGDPVKPDLGIIFEVQMKPSKRKTYTWPAYMATLRARKECPVTLLVLCPDRATAARCAEWIDTGHPGWVLKPLVMSLADIPAVTDPGKAREMPELAALSALAQGGGPLGRPVLEAFCAGLEVTASDVKAKYYDYIASHLPEAARKILEDIVATSTYQFQTDFLRESQAKGKAEGMAEGMAKGMAKGKAEALAEAVLRVLARRDLVPSEEERGRITSCTDLELLEVWHDRAITAESVEELFA